MVSSGTRCCFGEDTKGFPLTCRAVEGQPPTGRTNNLYWDEVIRFRPRRMNMNRDEALKRSNDALKELAAALKDGKS